MGKFPVVLGWVCYMAGSAMISGLAGLPLSFVRSYRGKGRGADLCWVALADSAIETSARGIAYGEVSSTEAHH